MAAQNQGDLFDAYFRRADLDGNGEISGVEAVAFFQAANLPKQVLAQIWNFADQNRRGSLGRPEFYNALKLVTVAQRKRDLTPDIVRAALFGQASASIPAPQINLGALPTPSASQMAHGGTTASQIPGVRPALFNTTINQQYSRPPASGLVRPPTSVSGAATSPVQGAVFPGFSAGASPLGSNLPTVSAAQSSDARVENSAKTQTSAFSGSANSPLPNHAGILSGARIATVASLPSTSPVASGLPSPSTMQLRPQVTQNGFASGPRFGGDTFSAARSQPNTYGSVGTTSASSVQVSSPSVPISADGLSTDGQHLKMQQSHLKKDAQNLVPSIRPFGPPAVSPQASTGHQQQLQWPRVTQTDIQKYTKVFIEVDTDKDGKITGDQARNLFLSWRLPIEVLKQVWTLSDQDNDSMLSVREFCIALYLMERHREGRPLPAMLPSSVLLDFPATVQPVSGYGKTLVFSAGFQPQGPGAGQRPGARPPGKPPLPIPAPSSDDRLPPKTQKAKVPVLDKHLVDQLSEEEQKSLNLKFQEASEANKKVDDLEKEIKESREKMEFYRVKMQELVLYKSRCDNHLNEVTERAAMDKREVESLAKKYEEKYLQTGNVASKLTIEEATFRDIQERKMEMYQAVVKMEQDGSDEILQARADHIQSSLEELVRSLSERCKKYGLRSKPTMLVELPFGWQPGIQEGAADWDEGWDKFEDEGFTFVKEMTLDVLNVITPPKPKVKVSKKEKAVAAKGEAVIHASDIKSKVVKPATKDTPEAENGVMANHKEDNGVRSPVASPSAKNAHGSPHNFLKEDHSEKTVGSSTSPRSKQPLSNIAFADTPSSGDKRSDKPAWGTFDTNDDADSFSGSSKVVDHERRIDDLFGHGQFTLPPIRTSSSQADGFLPKKSVFADSMPGTPVDVFLPKKSIFDDSVPSTPAERFLPNHSIFADSVPSTPLGGGLEEHGYNFSRFDSFRSTDSGFQPQERLSRFDSMRSTRDFDSEDGGSFQQRETFSRFDSMRSTNDSDFGLRFSSFDDSNPLGSGPFKSSFGSETPRRDSDGFGSSTFETPRSDVDPFGSVGPFRSSLAGETPRVDSDPYGQPFRSPLVSETPRADTDFYGSGAPFGSSFGSETSGANRDHFGSSTGGETPRGETNYFAQSSSFKSSFESETPRGEFNSFGFGGDHIGSGPFGSSAGGETPRRETNYFAQSSSFKSSFESETPRGEFDSFGFGGPFGSSFSSETPRQDPDTNRSSGPFNSTMGSEKPKGETDSWSAF